ncbi:MAG: hypothetical protein AAFU64_02655, partial [Bacteroidota bacterium]
MPLYAQLHKENYELILDMQRNRYSPWLRYLLAPPAFAEFDRYSPQSVLKHYQWSFEQAGLGEVQVNYSFARHYSSSKKLFKISFCWRKGGVVF